MRNLLRAIARLLGITTQPTDKPVQQTQTVGPVSQELIQQFGRVHSAPDTDLQPPPQFPLPAQAVSSKKPRTAKRTTAASKDSSKKQKPAPTGKSQYTRGSSTPTPASKTRPHAKPAAKAKP